jgi:aryl-alcohol dehydrogenase-like predicted oxidoreductase
MGATRKTWRGPPGLSVIAPGLGCVSLAGLYGRADDDESLQTLRLAIDRGGCLLDTADDYGPPAHPVGHNEELVGRAIAGRREEVVVATKCGSMLVSAHAEQHAWPFASVINGRPENIKSSCNASLRRLSTDYIDIYLLHRVDPGVAIEETVGAMHDLVHEGKVRYIGLCEPSARTLERACAVHDIAVIQNEWSLWTRDIEGDLLSVVRNRGVSIMAYAPLGRGMLTGAIKSVDDLSPTDYRRSLPRFQGENFVQNLKLVDLLMRLASRRSCTAAQMAIAWLLAQGDDVLPIPGARTRDEVEENLAAGNIDLTAEDLAALDSLATSGVVAGNRYDYGSPQGDTPE